MIKDKSMKKLLIFIFILIAVVSCNNASKTGTSYNNSSNNNTEQGSNEEGNQTGEDSSTEQGEVLIQEKMIIQIIQ